MKNIYRRKPVHSHSSVQGQGYNCPPLNDTERQRLKGTIDNLKNDIELLRSDLWTQEEEKRGFEMQFQQLREKFQQIKQRHRSMLSILADAMEKLAFQDRKRRFPPIGCIEDFDSTQIEEERELQTLVGAFDRLALSLSYWKEVVQDAGQSKIGISLASIVDIDEATSCELNMDAQNRIDMNSEPNCVAAGSDSAALTDQREVSSAVVAREVSSAVVASGINDVFWEQFLTENPGSSENEATPPSSSSGGRKMNGSLETRLGDNGRTG